MGTKSWEMICDENGSGGHCEYCGDNDAHIGFINAFYLVNHTRERKLSQTQLQLERLRARSHARALPKNRHKK
jgi:hypothetical protein